MVLFVTMYANLQVRHLFLK